MKPLIYFTGVAVAWAVGLAATEYIDPIWKIVYFYASTVAIVCWLGYWLRADNDA